MLSPTCAHANAMLDPLLSAPPPPLVPSLAPPARPRYTWRPHAAATDHNAFIIIPCFCFPLLPSTIVDTNLAREYPRGVTHTTQSFLWWGGMLEILFPQDLVQMYRVASSVPFPLSVWNAGGKGSTICNEVEVHFRAPPIGQHPATAIV